MYNYSQIIKQLLNEVEKEYIGYVELLRMFLHSTDL
jgi:hypothetical protein